ncbi:WD40 repeat-like protein [Favolaschia claudopus]|uniref:WD40 repeat-like protein n=1 Tax=Favolaschia claudopus TaxID=2862362 RepID=A0AAW0A2U6_9AGAR
MPMVLTSRTQPSSKNQNFVVQGTLDGHRGAILCLGTTEDGKFAASGGSDGTRIWNLETMAQISRPAVKGIRGWTTAVLWIRREDDAAEILLYGTEQGYLVCWKQATPSSFEEIRVWRFAIRAEITALCFDAASNRLVVVNRASTLYSFALNRDLSLRRLSVCGIADVVPKAVAFGDMKDQERQILVFGLFDGQVHTVHGSSIVGQRELGGMIGDASVNVGKGLFVIDDPHQGVGLYRIDDSRRLKTFEIPQTQENPRPRQVCFADDAKLIVCGSDHGVAFVFDRWNEQIVDELYFGAADWLQTITAVDMNESTMILGARSRDLQGSNKIIVWRGARTKKPMEASAIWGYLVHVLNVIVGIAMFYYLSPYLPGLKH